MWSTYDVLEPILLQVAVKLFKVNRFRLLLPHPDVTTLITVNSVCRDWWEVITGRKVIRRRLKLTFRKVCFLRWDIQRVCLNLSFLVGIHNHLCSPWTIDQSWNTITWSTTQSWAELEMSPPGSNGMAEGKLHWGGGGITKTSFSL